MSIIHKSNNDIFYQIYRLFADHFIQLVYHGFITSEKADALINIFEQLLVQNEAKLKIQKRAFYILVEALQNVIRHQAKPDSSLTHSGDTLTFRYLDGQFMFTLKNLIETTHIAPLKKKIELLNRMTKDDLNKYYKKILKNDVLSDKGGAGLGLIEIARKSENLLQYDFREADDTYSYFYLNMLVANHSRPVTLFPENGIYDTRLIHRFLQGPGTWFILRETYHSNLPPELQSSVNTYIGIIFQNKNFKKFLSLLNHIPQLCLASSGLSVQQVKMPCLFYFVKEDNHLSVYAGLVLPYSSPFDHTLFSNFFTQTHNSSFPGKPDLNSEAWKPLLELPDLLSSPPRIMMHEVSSTEKFIVIKFSL